MKAMIFTQYGSPDVFRYQEVEKPAPKANEVLIKIVAATVTTGDCEIRSFKVAWFIWLPMRIYMGIRKPRKQILGQELSGQVEAVGTAVTRFKAGDAVFSATGMSFGAYAEYVCLPADAKDSTDGLVAIKPANLSYEAAAVIPVGGLVALDFMRKAHLQPGEKVLINGAGGSIGTIALQLAKSFGAIVTAVDRSEKLEMLRALGTDHVIDYTQEDFTQNGTHYDVIFDIVGKTSFSRSLKALAPHGRYLLANPSLSHFFRGIWISRTSNKKVVFATTQEKSADLTLLKDLFEAGTLKSVIDKTYPLEKLVEAHRYVDSGHKKGNIVITINHTD